MTSIECQEQIYKVPIVNTNKNDQEGDNNDDEEEKEKEQSYHTYILRGLKNDNELHQWTKFCATVFSYKLLNPPSEEYFYRHYFNDPNNDPNNNSNSTSNANPSKNSGHGHHSLVRVAFDNKNQIVASCRIVLRTISTGRRRHSQQEEDKVLNLNLNCGGIGEVCTDITHRRRGLSTILLKNALHIMKERKDIHISSLHASFQFFPLYKSLGYISTCTSSGNRWSTVPMTIMLEASSSLSHRCTSIPICNSNHHHHHHYNNNNNNNNSGGVVREARFPQDTEQLHQLHRYYSEQRLLGCIVRSKEYWTKYISEELKGSLFVLVQQQQQQQLLDVGKEDEEKDRDYIIVAWLSLRSTTTTTTTTPSEDDDGYRRSFQIQEFGMNLSLLPKSTKTNNNNNNNNSNNNEKLLSHDDISSSISIYVALKTLVLHALEDQERQQQQQQQQRYEGGDDMTRERRRKETILLSLPGFLRDEIHSDYSISTRSSGNNNHNNHPRTDDDGNHREEDDKSFTIDWNSEQFSTDNGWMYQALSPSDKDDNDNNNNEEDNNNHNHNNRTPEIEFLDFIRRGSGDMEKEDEQRRQHFVWPSDSF
ncbi:hypothetical protein FRACYDRAFT_241132 [Fragilariopsis cylindrus CCMP1102]|uniref:N-acetyltransferase domain-containing protein n=1 Tax=Fragilariopsis cylindrus CCMP1102 TaxID=635003 RepID=A0A1E7F9R7_9STRA|nr:hypothetical protein FRACYDRAFT_241132 [Fragilariopsis cylindrus CCMP1102]|eukprot:OEU14583.1 hypothetical protein FRACYDRAFT_241132 [Fragilariopsis cylindrus CCMP1102]